MRFIEPQYAVTMGVPSDWRPVEPLPFVRQHHARAFCEDALAGRLENRRALRGVATITYRRARRGWEVVSFVPDEVTMRLRAALQGVQLDNGGDDSGFAR